MRFFIIGSGSMPLSAISYIQKNWNYYRVFLLIDFLIFNNCLNVKIAVMFLFLYYYYLNFYYFFSKNFPFCVNNWNFYCIDLLQFRNSLSLINNFIILSANTSTDKKRFILCQIQYFFDNNILNFFNALHFAL